MKIVVTGASGFVGSQLVPILIAEGHEVLLVGRDPNALARQFPEQSACSYAELASAGRGFDCVVHLAVLNNDVETTRHAFMQVNVDFLLDVLARSRRAGIATFINVSSTHALDAGRTDPYSASKRAAADSLRGEPGVVTLYMPPLYGERWAGTLSFLNRVPRPLANVLFGILAALKPVAHVRRIAEALPRLDPADREIVLSDGQARNPVYRVTKRLIDLAFASLVIVLFWWLLLILWAVVRLQTHGPGIFSQRRVGRAGRTFTCLKFRTMAVGTVEVGTHDVSLDAITPIGHRLRTTKLDELPQVLNILRNQVSLVGPRPCLPVQTELIRARKGRGVFDLKPGITGLAQVNGIDMSDPQRLAMWDSHYGAMQSLLLDLRIILATLRSPRQRIVRVVPGRPAPADRRDPHDSTNLAPAEPQDPPADQARPEGEAGAQPAARSGSSTE